MTTIEHAILGGYLVLASGANRRFGWPLVAMAGMAAVVPDWDGLTLLYSAALCDVAHRCWGHALVVCLPIAVLLSVLDYRFDCITRLARFGAHWLRITVDKSKLVQRSAFDAKGYLAWVLAATIATLSHVCTDMIFSGHADFADWPIKIFWPFREIGFVYPMVPWGDIGVTIVFFCGMFAMLKWQKMTQHIAILTLVATTFYIVVRGSM